MKFTSEDLLKAMGLSVGDRVKYSYISLVAGIERKLIVEIVNDGGMVHLKNNDNTISYLTELVDTEIEILPRPKHVGDLICNETDCKNCPMKCLECLEYINAPETIYERLKRWYEYYKDQEIYDLLKARLDKEVKEYENI